MSTIINIYISFSYQCDKLDLQLSITLYPLLAHTWQVKNSSDCQRHLSSSCTYAVPTFYWAQ